MRGGKIFKSLLGWVLLAVLVISTGLSYLSLFLRLRISPGFYFLNVGQGDSQLVIFESGEKLLIDGGPSWSKLSENLDAALPKGDRYIDAVLMTHPQGDHFGGLVELVKRYKVGVFLSSEREAQTSQYEELVFALSQKGVKRVNLAEGDGLRLAGARVQVLAPSKAEAQEKDLNESSVVLMISFKGVQALFTGDISSKVESRLARDYDVRADILKVSHHGSKFSSGEDFLAEVLPKVAVIGVGKNSYGHPTEQTLQRLEKFSEIILRTDKNGLIKIVRNLETGNLDIFNIAK